MKSSHCEDNIGDRKKGAETEIKFAEILLKNNRAILACHKNVADALNLRVEILPDSSAIDVVFLNKQNKKIAAEIKGKYPTQIGTYGLEEARFKELLRAKEYFDGVFYIIFNTNEQKWITAEVGALQNNGTSIPGKTYYNAAPVKTNILYWSVDLWRPLFGNQL